MMDTMDALFVIYINFALGFSPDFRFSKLFNLFIYKVILFIYSVFTHVCLYLNSILYHVNSILYHVQRIDPYSGN